MAHWGMVIDLRNCIGCRACTIACKQMNKVPPSRWRRVVDCGVSDPPERQRTFLPVSCMHCSEPPCLEVCPTGATYRRPDGIVDVNGDLCLGCGYCVVACPYMARTIIFCDGTGFESGMMSWEPGMAIPNSDHVGVATKCNFCLPRVEAGLAQGLWPERDPEAMPACVAACTAEALHFGDLDDPHSVVSQLIQENETARLQEELGTGPSVYYIVE
jgi:phenylacetyl-CoA:acceptor oxidoreductase subunit 1